MVGSKLGHYEITRRLGGGGMGEVYAARDTRLNREVAIKLLPDELAQRDDRRDRFEREAKTVASLSHPNIVTVHAVEEAEGRSFIVMELVRGRTLSELIPPGGIPLEEFFRVALPLADAIHAAHMRGVSHRDLKPTNVMVSDDGHVKVLDFGLAKVMEPDTDPDGVTRASSGLTAEGRILGTVAYMSPEQAEGKVLDHRSDVFSLGILLFEMLTGRRPFTGESNIATLSSILRDEPGLLAERREGVPLALERIVARALEKAPDRRYQSAADLRRDLEDLRRDMDTGELLASVSHSQPPRVAPVLSPSRRSRAALIAIFGVVTVFAALAGLALAGWPWGADDSGGSQTRAGSGAGAGVGSATVAADAQVRPSLAVFYFANLEGDPEIDWLRTGLTDMLVTQLSQSPDVRVLGTDRLHQLLSDHGVLGEPTIPFDTVQAIAAEAGVNRSVVGSFLREDGRLRISARVQDVNDGRVIWSETVEGGADDGILDLADTLAARIRSTFEAADTDADREVVTADAPDVPAEPRNLREVTSADLDAWKQFSAGARAEKEQGPGAAIPHFEAALDADPDFALALAKLSELHDTLGEADLAAEYAGRALEKGERLPMPHRMFLEGRIDLFGAGEAPEARQAIERTMEMFPEMARSLDMEADIAGSLLDEDRPEEAIARLEAIWARGGADLKTARTLADAYAADGAQERGVAVLREYVQRRPTDPAGPNLLAQYLLRWNPARAGEAIADATRRGPVARELGDLRWTAMVLDEEWTAAAGLATEAAGSDDPALRWQGRMAAALLALYRGDAESAIELLAGGYRAVPEGDPLRAHAAHAAVSRLLPIPAPAAALAIVQDALARPMPDHLSRDLVRMAAVAALLNGDEATSATYARSFNQATERLPLPESLRRREGAHLRGQLAAARGDYREAARELRAVVSVRGESRPDAVVTAYELAHALHEIGEREQAAEWFQRIVDAGPARADRPTVWIRSLFYLGSLAETRGERDAGAGYYRRFLSYRQGGTMDRELVQRASESLARIPD